MTEFKRSDYVAAAKDLINVMGLSDDEGKKLTVDGKANVATLLDLIKNMAGQIDPETDAKEDFAEGTLAILEQIGFNGFEAPKVDGKAIANTATTEDDDDWEERPGVEKELEPAKANADLSKEDFAIILAGNVKLKDLKDMVNENDLFKKLRKTVDNYQGLQGPKLLKAEMIKVAGITLAEPVKKEKATKTGHQGTAEKKPGIILRIAQLISDAGKKGITKTEILKELVTEFPERKESAMKATINVQIPARISKEKFPIAKTEDGRWFKK